MTTLLLQFPANHPCGAGHFPGNAIIPGALLLDEVLACISASLDAGDMAWRIKSAKFPGMVRPGDKVHINFNRSDNGDISFECTVSDSRVMSGTSGIRPVSAGEAPL